VSLWGSRVLGAALVLAWVLWLTGCTSQSRKTMVNLDASHERYRSQECQMAMGRAPVHDDIKYSRMIASPVAVLLSGGALALPVLAVNAGLDTVDHMDASTCPCIAGGQKRLMPAWPRMCCWGWGSGWAWASEICRSQYTATLSV